MKILKALTPLLFLIVPFFVEVFNIKVKGDLTTSNLVVSYVCLILFILITAISYKTNKIFLMRVRPLLIFNIFIIGIYLLQIAAGLSQLLAVLNILKAYLYSSALIIYFVSLSLKKDMKWIKYLLYSVVPLFLIQLGLSFWESHNGSYVFGDNDWINKVYIGLNIESRIIFSIVSKNLYISQYFTLPFSGLLGQWNYWGTQLPFYNLIFWFLYLVYKQKFILVFIFLTLFAVILNTSRFGITAVLVTDVILYLKFINKHKWTLYLLVAFFIGFIYTNIDLISYGWDQYFSTSDTISSRLSLYDTLIQEIGKMDVSSVLVGSGTKLGADYVYRISRNNNSFENEYFSKLFLCGIAGLLAFISLIFGLFQYFKKENTLLKYFGVLFLVNIVFTTLIANCIFNVYIYFFVTLLYLLLSNYENIYER